jgi:hypothetical protein
LESKELPIWRQLKKEGFLSTLSVFETSVVRSAESGVPEWNFLVLSHIVPSTTKEAFLVAQDKRFGMSAHSSRCAEAPSAETQRIEMLRSTANAHYPRETAEENRIALEENLRYSIEYITVHDTPAELNELNHYREIMRTNLGPAMGRRIQERLFFSGIALETVSVLYAQPSMSKWNQIHVMGRYPDDRRSLPNAQQTGTQPPNPPSGPNLGATLDSIRSKPRTDEARQLFNLAIR